MRSYMRYCITRILVYICVCVLCNTVFVHYAECFKLINAFNITVIVSQKNECNF